MTEPPNNLPPVIDYRTPEPPSGDRPTWLLFFGGLLGGSALSFALLFGGFVGADLVLGWIAIKVIGGIALCGFEQSRPAGVGLILSVPFTVLVFFVGCAVVIAS